MKQNPVTRRNLLKMILAGGAVVSSSAFLPKKWVKPVVESGVLPVHAQTSAPTATTEPSPVPIPDQAAN